MSQDPRVPANVWYHSSTQGRASLALVAGGLTMLALTLSGCERGLGGGGLETPTVAVLIDDQAVLDAGGDTVTEVVQVAGYGTLKGSVVLRGNPPTLSPTILQSQIKADDAAVCVFEEIPHQENLQVGANGALANVFVYLPRAPKGARPSAAAPEPVKFDQKICIFKPHCLTVQTDQTILILNSDPILHNTHTFPQKNSPFNSGVKPGESQGVPLVYQRAENTPVKVVCDIHPWMGAFHLPLDHAYSAVTGAEGTFTISDLPAGTHDFTVWHELAGEISSRYQVTIAPDSTTEVEIEIDAASLAAFEGPRPKNVVLSVLP